MSELVIGLIIGAVGALVAAALVGAIRFRQTGRRHHQDLADLESTILELRRDASEDKETNRRLRHELAVKTPGHLLETATMAEMERDGAIGERDQALEQLDLVQRDLGSAKTRLTEQDAKLRQYREALQEIRLSLEAQGRGRTLEPASGMLADELDAPVDQDPLATGADVAERSMDEQLAGAERLAAAGGDSGGSTPEPVDLGAGD